MNKNNLTYHTNFSDKEFARKAIDIAKVTNADVLIYVTENGTFAQHFIGSKLPCRILAATAVQDTFIDLTKAGIETLRLPLHAIDKHRQIRHVLSVALRTKSISVGELIVCVIGQDAYPGEANVIIVTEAESSQEEIVITDLIKLTNGIRPKALESAIFIACKLGRAARRGKRIGTILMLGDSQKVLENSKQLIPNPFKGHKSTKRMLTNPEIHDALIELSKLDGAFIVRGDGFIQTAGAFLTSSDVEVELPAGLGTRHVAAASATVYSTATGIVVSATDGNVRVFSGGRMVLRIDPEIEHGPIHIGD